MSSVLFNVEGHVGTLTLNRPEALNSLDADMARAWARAAKEAVSNDAVQAIVIRGEGPAFCAGGDVKAMHAMAERGEAITALVQEINSGLRALVRSEERRVGKVCGPRGMR